MNKKSVIKKILFAAKNVAFFVRPTDDPDSLAAALALAHLIKQRGGQARVFTGRKPPQAFAFLDPNQIITQDVLVEKILQISVPAKNSKISGLTYQKTEQGLQIKIRAKDRLPAAEDIKIEARALTAFDLIVTVGVGELKELGKTFFEHTELFYQTTIINLSSRADTKEFGKVDLIDLKYHSNTELVFDLLNDWNPDLINQQIASDLLAGLTSHTQSFQRQMVSPAQFDLAADLIGRGADRTEVIRQLYKTKDLNKLKLWGQILAGLKTYGQGQVVWSIARFSALADANQHQADILDLLRNYLGHTPSTELASIFILTRSPSPTEKAPPTDQEPPGTHGPADDLQKDTLIRAYIAAPKNINALRVANQLGQARGDSNLATVKFSRVSPASVIEQYKKIGELFLSSGYNKRTENHDQLPTKTKQTITYQKHTQAKA